MSDKSTCSECNAVFKRLYDLRKHVKKFHGGEEKLDQLAPLKKCANATKTYNFSCDICKKNFNHKRHLTFHKKTHGVSVNSASKNAKKCPLCSFTKSSKIQLHNHFKENHDIEICFENLAFATKDDFELWKNGIEQNSKSKFIKACGDIVCESRRKIYYVCHRSGCYTSESRNKRHLKTQGSSKIGGFCPSGINVTVDKNGQYEVAYLKTHVGHTMDLCHLTLSTEEKQEIAAKIAMKIPFSDILDEVRDGVSKDSIQRIHLLTRKDLNNITAGFNLQSEAVRQPNDVISIEAWMNDKSMEPDVNIKTEVDDGWEILSSSETPEFYQIQKNEVEDSECQLTCSNCKIDIHKYSCSCLDSSNQWNMCKRIPLLGPKLQNQETTMRPADEALDDESDLHIHIDSKNAEAGDTYKCLSTSSSNDVCKGDSLQDKKEKMKKWFDSVLQSIESDSQFQILAKLVAPIKPSLEVAVVNEKTEQKVLKAKIQVPYNKKIDQHSTKKKTKEFNELKKSTTEERNNVTARAGS